MSSTRRASSRIARRLATIALAGDWSAADIATRLSGLLNFRRPHRWISAWAERIVAHFGIEPPLPTVFRLARFLASDRATVRAEKRLWKMMAATAATLDLEMLPRPSMAPAPGLPQMAPIPVLNTPGDVARWLQISSAELDWFADCFGRERRHPPGPLRHYRYLWISKSAGRRRLLEIPKPRLKAMQRRILDEILAAIPPHEAAHAFRSGFSTVSCAQPHVGQRVVLRIDLRDFFPSVRSGRVQGLFHTLGYPEAVARLLSGLCTNSVPWDVVADEASAYSHGAARSPFEIPHLPQGAPTSPALANLCAFRLDCRLAGLARQAGIHYTRYADDLIFSGGRPFERSLAQFRILVCAIVLDEGFSIRRRKTRVMRSGGRQEVTGIVVNRRTNVSRDEYDQLKAIVHNCVRTGPRQQNRDGHENFRDHLAGRIAYIAMVHPARGQRLQTLFDRINWTDE